MGAPKAQPGEVGDRRGNDCGGVRAAGPGGPVRDTLSHAKRNGQVVRGHAWGFDMVDPVKLLNGSLRLG
jgi:hypothetical protein